MVTKIPETFSETAAERRNPPSAPSAKETQAAGDKAAAPASAASEAKSAAKAESHQANKPRWRRRLVPLLILALVVIVLLVPWEASVGSYGTLIATPTEEVIIRAPESGTLVELFCQPGDLVASGAVIGRLRNYELDDQIVQVQADLARANTDYDSWRGELRTRNRFRAGSPEMQRGWEYWARRAGCGDLLASRKGGV